MEMFQQWEHYRALENDLTYRMEFLLDARLEEMSWRIPWTLEPEVVATPQEPWMQKQWNAVEQIRCMFTYLNGRLSDLEKQVNEHGNKPRWK